MWAVTEQKTFDVVDHPYRRIGDQKPLKSINRGVARVVNPVAVDENRIGGNGQAKQRPRETHAKNCKARAP